MAHPKAQPGTNNTRPHTTSHETQKSCVQADDRANHSRSSSPRARLESPMKSAVPMSKDIISSGGEMVTYSAHEVGGRTLLVTNQAIRPVQADMITTPRDSETMRRREPRFRLRPCVARKAIQPAAEGTRIQRTNCGGVVGISLSPQKKSES